jgi:EmrB/QacA subfamily drug resistance transporter
MRNKARTNNSRWLAMGATALTLLVVGLDMTILNVALPDIALDLHASYAQLQWFADAYLLVLAAVMLPAGMLADRLGRKGLTLFALSVFGAGSLWCACARTSGALIGGRALLGLGAAFLVPLAMSAVVVLFEPRERPKALLVLSVSTMVGLPLGPIAGGLLLQHYWWGSIFLVNLPVVALALVAVGRFLPGGKAQEPTAGIDFVGVIASGGGLLGLTYGLIEAPARGWGDPVVLGCTCGGLFLLAGFLMWERRLSGALPVFDFEVWSNRAFRWGAVAAAVASLAFFGVVFTVPQYFRAVLGADALGTGVRTLPMVGGVVVAMRVVNLLGARVSGRLVATLGFVLTAAGLSMGATTEVSSGFLRSAVWTSVVGAGFGAALFSAQNTALLNLPRPRAATGSALVQTLRQVGSVLGIALLGALLNDRYRSSVDDAGLSSAMGRAVRESAQSGMAVAHATGSPALGRSVSRAFVSGMDLSLWASAGVAVFGAVVAVVFLQPLKKPEIPGDRKGDCDAVPGRRV